MIELLFYKPIMCRTLINNLRSVVYDRLFNDLYNNLNADLCFDFCDNLRANLSDYLKEVTHD